MATVSYSCMYSHHMWECYIVAIVTVNHNFILFCPCEIVLSLHDEEVHNVATATVNHHLTPSYLWVLWWISLLPWWLFTIISFHFIHANRCLSLADDGGYHTVAMVTVNHHLMSFYPCIWLFITNWWWWFFTMLPRWLFIIISYHYIHVYECLSSDDDGFHRLSASILASVFHSCLLLHLKYTTGKPINNYESCCYDNCQTVAKWVSNTKELQ